MFSWRAHYERVVPLVRCPLQACGAVSGRRWQRRRRRRHLFFCAALLLLLVVECHIRSGGGLGGPVVVSSGTAVSAGRGQRRSFPGLYRLSALLVHLEIGMTAGFPASWWAYSSSLVWLAVSAISSSSSSAIVVSSHRRSSSLVFVAASSACCTTSAGGGSAGCLDDDWRLRFFAVCCCGDTMGGGEGAVSAPAASRPSTVVPGADCMDRRWWKEITTRATALLGSEHHRPSMQSTPGTTAAAVSTTRYSLDGLDLG